MATSTRRPSHAERTAATAARATVAGLTIGGTATITAGTYAVGPEQFGRTATAGDVVRVTTVTNDGRFAYVSHRSSCGYVPVTRLAAVAA